MRGGRIDGLRRARGCARRARPELSVACGAAGGARRTGIVSSMADLTLDILNSSEGERAVDREHHLEQGPRERSMTCAAEFKPRKIQPFKSVKQVICVSKHAKEAAAHARRV